MARSEAQYQSEDSDRERDNDFGCEKDSMKAPARRLRSVALSGISREEQNILTVFSRSLPKLHHIIPSPDARWRLSGRSLMWEVGFGVEQLQVLQLHGDGEGRCGQGSKDR